MSRTRRRMPSRWIAVTLPAVVALGLGACVPEEPGADEGSDEGSGSGGDAGGELSIGTTADVVNYNPLVGNSRTDTWITNLMYPSMMSLNDDGEKIPAVATDWGYGEDGLTAWIEIRDDMQWSDGEALTAEDVVFTIEAVVAEQLGTVAGMIGSYESAEAVSETRIEFALNRPDGAFLNSVGFWMPIVPEHVFSQAPSVADFANDSDWVSAGPFVLTEVDRGQRYVMEAVDSYPLGEDGSPNLDQVVFRVYPDVNTEVLALRSGELDLIANALPPAVADDVSDDSELETYVVPSLGWAHMQYNMRREPLDQVEVRRALAHAVDYEAIREVVLGGHAVSANSSILTPTFTQWVDESAQEYEYDPEQSRQLMTDAGFTDDDGDGMFDGVDLEMVYDSGDPNISSWAELVRDQAAEAGITISLAGLARNTYLSRTDERDFDIYAGSWAVIDEPQSNFNLLFAPDGFINYAGVDDPEINRLLEESSKALTVEDAREPLHELAAIVTDQVYDNVMYVEEFTFVSSTEWTGFEPKPSELLSVVNPQSLASVRAAD